MSREKDKRMGFYEAKSRIFFTVESEEEYEQILRSLPMLQAISQDQQIQESFEDFDKLVSEIESKPDPKESLELEELDLWKLVSRLLWKYIYNAYFAPDFMICERIPFDRIIGLSCWVDQWWSTAWLLQDAEISKLELAWASYMS